jgi:hypothetical protein
MFAVYVPHYVKKTLNQVRGELADSIWPGSSAMGVVEVDQMFRSGWNVPH